MHGNGARRNCPECGQRVGHITDKLSHRELRGPRQITSSNIDRIFDDEGRRMLLIEEKQPNEPVPGGQWALLRALGKIPEITVWGVRGTPDSLRITDLVSLEVLAEGNWDTYQQAVTDWFKSPRPAPRDWLATLAEAPFDAPAWCSPDVWRDFDKALTQVLSQRSLRESA